MKKLLLTIRLIWQGWTNLLLDIVSDIKYRDIFKARYEICKTCEFNKLGICTKCGCVLKAKTKSEDSECPEGKWKTVKETLQK